MPRVVDADAMPMPRAADAMPTIRDADAMRCNKIPKSSKNKSSEKVLKKFQKSSEKVPKKFLSKLSGIPLILMRTNEKDHITSYLPAAALRCSLRKIRQNSDPRRQSFQSA
jgi:hypothetical protein